MKKFKQGRKPVLRDKILGLLSDGKPRHINEIKELLRWNKKTSITKTLKETKESLLLTRDTRRLHRKKFDNANKGAIWWLEVKS